MSANYFRISVLHARSLIFCDTVVGQTLSFLVSSTYISRIFDDIKRGIHSAPWVGLFLTGNYYMLHLDKLSTVLFRFLQAYQ